MNYYSYATGGFYSSDIFSAFPPDAVELSAGEFQILLDGSRSGQVIIPDENGKPTLAPPPPPSDLELLTLSSNKLLMLKSSANAMKSSIAIRISELEDASDLGMATDAEKAEYPGRQAQLLEWKRYAVLLSRVDLVDGWHVGTVWPEPPSLG